MNAGDTSRVSASSSPDSRAITISTAIRPIRSPGTSMIDTGTGSAAASSAGLTATIDRSSGTRSPRSAARASRPPRAASLCTTSPVVPGCAASTASSAAAPPENVGSAGTTAASTPAAAACSSTPCRIRTA